MFSRSLNLFVHNLTLAQEQQKQQKLSCPQLSAYRGPAAPQNLLSKAERKRERKREPEAVQASSVQCSSAPSHYRGDTWRPSDKEKCTRGLLGEVLDMGSREGEHLKEDRAGEEERRSESETLSFTLLCKYIWGWQRWTQPGNHELSG